MCGRLSLHHLPAVHALADLLGIPLARVNMDGIAPRYNYAPTMLLPVIWQQERQLSLLPMTWGVLPGWATKRGQPSKRLVNARSETVYELPTFQDSVRTRRCVIVANGFFEWKRDQNDKPLGAYYIRPTQADWMAVAGIYQTNPEGLRECCLLTTCPNQIMAPIHDRMPCMLTAEEIPIWLEASSRSAGEILLRSNPEDAIMAVPVSSKVNSIRNEGANLIQAVRPHEAQGDLFN